VSAAVLERNGNRARIQLTADGYCYLTRLEGSHPGLRFSTNYRDLRDGDSCIVDVTGLQPTSALQVASYCRPGAEIEW
jgi:hypothetical protein